MSNEHVRPCQFSGLQIEFIVRVVDMFVCELP